MKAIVIGTCGRCGGQVVQPAAANFPAPPRCERCNAPAVLPVMTMAVAEAACVWCSHVRAGQRAQCPTHGFAAAGGGIARG